MRKIVISVSDNCFQDICAIARETDCSPSAVVRWATLLYLSAVVVEPYENACQEEPLK